MEYRKKTEERIEKYGIEGRELQECLIMEIEKKEYKDIPLLLSNSFVVSFSYPLTLSFFTSNSLAFPH